MKTRPVDFKRDYNIEYHVQYDRELNKYVAGTHSYYDARGEDKDPVEALKKAVLMVQSEEFQMSQLRKEITAMELDTYYKKAAEERALKYKLLTQVETSSIAVPKNSAVMPKAKKAGKHK